MSLLSVSNTETIVLKRKQKVEVYQVSMELLVQNKQHPFIAILILAGELHAKGYEHITPNLLKQHLLPNLPERACWNLLDRISKEQYFEKIEYLKDCFKLTNLGKECIESKSVWVGEKGIYNLYFTESPFVNQQIIAVTQVESKAAQDSAKAQLIHSNEIKALEGKSIQIKNIDNQYDTYEIKNYYIETIDNKYFQLPDQYWDLQCVAKPNATVELHLVSGRNKYECLLATDHQFLRTEMLKHQFNPDYNSHQNCIFTSFDATRLTFLRDVTIQDFHFWGEKFEPSQLFKVQHRPKTIEDAQKWYHEMLKNKISKYYTDEVFEIESENGKSLFQPYFNLPLLLRQDLIQTFNNSKDDFYLKAKLETIDFLTY
jgi:hypothetical protein